MQDGGFCYDMWQMRHLSGSSRRVLAAVLALAVQMASAEEVSGAEVYWFDDTGVGACRVPASWKVQVKASSEAPWRDVTTERPGVANRFNGVSFAPARAKAVRLVVKLQKDFSGGVLKWKLK